MRTTHIIRCLLTAPLIVGALASGLHAQHTDVVFERIKLPGAANRVAAIAQDHEGFMWFGNNRGLFRYDGHNFKEFGHEFFRIGGERKGYENIWDLRVGPSGMLWIATSVGGLHRLDPRTDEKISYRHDPDTPNSPSSNNVLKTIEDRNGIVWIGTDVGLDRFEPSTGTFKSYRHHPDDSTSLSLGWVWSLYEDRAGTLWVGTDDEESQTGGFNRFDPHTETFKRYVSDPADKTTLTDSRVGPMYEDSLGRFWVGTKGDGLHTMDRERGTFTRYLYDPKHPERPSRPHIPGAYERWSSLVPITFIHEDGAGVLWIGAHSGGINLYDLERGQMTHYEADLDDSGSLTSNRIWSLSESRDGVIWIATLASRGWEALHKAVRVTPFHFYAPDSTISGNNRVAAIHESADGTLWIGTENGGLIAFDRSKGKATRYRHDPGDPNSLGSNHVWAIQESKDGHLWIGGYFGGLSRFDPVNKTFDRYLNVPSASESVANQAIRAMHLDGKGGLWIGTRWDGLAQFDPETGDLTYYRNEPDDTRSLSDNGVSAIHESMDGSLWIGTYHGLNRFDRESGTFDRFLLDQGWPGPITSIVEDKDGHLWIGSFDGSLARLERETGVVENVDTRNAGLPGNEIAAMLVDDRTNLWIRTEEAVTRFDVEDNRFYSYPLNPQEGFAGSSPAAHKSPAGELFFGGPNGFHSFYPEEILATENLVPPKVALIGFNVSEKKVEAGEDSPIERPIADADEIRLSHDQNVISFDFVGLHYLSPKKNRHLYLLEGYDDDWRETGPDRRASYFKVPPGTYTFRAKAANPFGVWSETEASIDVVILPPWWLSWWAYAIYIVSSGLLLVVVYRVRIRGLKRQAAKLGEMVDQKTKDLQEEKERTEEQARRLVELDEVKDRFFFNISHELRTPLTLILGPMQDLLSGAFGEVTAEARRQLVVMQRNGSRLHRLVSQLLDLSKLEVGRMPLHARERNLVPFVKLIVLSFAPLAERRKVALKFKAENAKLAVFFDSDKLEHVIANLLSNAFKFTSKHGKIFVDVTELNEGDTAHAEISVRDTGTGIPAEELPYIFDRFHQADDSQTRRREGSGIGLALAAEVVELHHGDIKVESEEGFGSAFVVRLPLGKEHLTPDELADEVGQEDPLDLVFREPAWVGEIRSQDVGSREDDTSASDGRPTVLIVDDNVDVREYLKSHLAGLYRVVEAVDGIEGLEIARESCPDLVLADVMMPRMDGFKLCQTIKEDHAIGHVPVILLTARVSEEAEVEGLEAGADDYIYKPFSSEALLARVENMIEIRKYLRHRFGSEVTIQPTGVTVDSSEAVFLDQVREAIEAHLGDANYSVEWLADDVGVSPRQLRRKLRELVNLSPTGFIRMVRLERAAQLLEQQVGNVSEVAYRVGFNDPRYFSRLFQQAFGTTPSSYPIESR